MLVRMPVWAWAAIGAEVAGSLLLGFGLFGQVARVVPEALAAVWQRVRADPRYGVVFVASVMLAAVPTSYTLFPKLSAPISRERLFLAWIVTAGIAGVAAAEQSSQVDRLIRLLAQRLARRTPRLQVAAFDERRSTAIPVLIDTILSRPPRDLIPAWHEFILYVRDEDTGLLTPAWRPRRLRGQLPIEWEVGSGATGQAWERRERVLATGDQVWNEELKVPPERANLFKDLKAVAAAPVNAADGVPIAVLTISSRRDRAFLATKQGHDAHLLIAACVGVALERLQIPPLVG